MYRHVLLGALTLLALTGQTLAASNEIRVLSFAETQGDETGKAITKALEKALQKKGYGVPGAAPEPALLKELKSRSLVRGESLDEVKGLQLGAPHLVVGSYTSKKGTLEIEARLVDIESGRVLDSVTAGGANAEAAGSAVADKLATVLGRPVDAAKTERVEVEVRGQAPGNLPQSTARRIALADAKRNAVEEGVGAVVDMKRVPDAKRVATTAQSTMSYSIIKEGKEGGRYVIQIAAKVDLPADLAQKYPAPAREMSDETGFKAYVERSSKGEVDWEKGILRVVGRSKPGGTDSKAQLLARRAAVADAYSRAMEVVAGVAVDEKDSVGDAAKKDENLSVRLKGLVQGGRVVAENPSGAQGLYEVTLEVPLRGLRGVQTVFLDRLGTPKAPQEKAEAGAEEDEFTGILIDARGTGLQAGLFPKIVDEEGNVLADPANSDPDLLKSKGQAAYVVGDPDKQGMLHERLGPKPMIFKAQVDGTYQVASLVPIIVAQQGTRGKVLERLAKRRQGPAPLKVKGLKSGGQTKVNMLVSTNYANRAKFQQSLAKAFGKCRVVVVMDSQIGGTEGRLGAPKIVELALQ